MNAFLSSYIRSTYGLTTNALDALCCCFHKIEKAKGNFLIQEGQVCQHLYLMEQGAVRGYYNLDGKEVTHWLGFEKDLVTSFYSFITRKPSKETVEFLEESQLWQISYDDLNQLYQQFPAIERMGRIACENYYIRLENRYVNFQFKSAAEKYQYMIENAPHILQRVPLGYIASYLGITQETLSRIRAKQ